MSETPPSSSLASLKMEGQLRDKIKELQEKRAAGLMAEISELRKEKSIAISQVKKMDTIVGDIRRENALLKKNERNFVSKIQNLERLLLEEKLINESYKKKNQASNKKIKELSEKLNTQQTLLSVSPLRRLGASDKYHSLTDLNKFSSNRENEKPPSSPTLKHGAQSMSFSSLSPSASPVPSPSVIHRRYRLATIQTSEKETQTDHTVSTEITSGQFSSENLPRPILEILASAREDILRLQQQNKDLQKQLHKLALEKQTTEELKQAYMLQTKILNEEADVLKESLSQFSEWAQNKISAIEEDMDLCRIVYSLHGSLSKEADKFEEVHRKLAASESSLQEERSVNKYLDKALHETEEQLKQLRLENSELKDQLEQLQNHYGTLSKINELRLHGRNLSLPSPLTKHREKYKDAVPTAVINTIPK